MSLEKLLLDKITYWQPKTKDGDGSFTYYAPRILNGRFQTDNQEFLSFAGQKCLSRAVVYVLEQLEFNGFIYNGISTSTTPESLAGAFRIQAYYTTHNPNKIIVVYKVILS